MTDIAERLRKFCKWPEPGDGIPNDPVFASVPDLKEAADEIERLRSDLHMWRERSDMWYAENVRKQAACEQMGARIVALEAQLAEAIERGNDWCDQAQKARAALLEDGR